MELPKIYEPVPSLDALQDRLSMFLNQYNDMIRGHGMDLVFFQDAVEHLIKVHKPSNPQSLRSSVINSQRVFRSILIFVPGR